MGLDSLGLVDLDSFSSIAICGVPRSGKTTLANAIHEQRSSLKMLHTDDLIGQYEWSELSSYVAENFRKWDLVEGVAVVRALRKILDGGLRGLPGCVIYLRRPIVSLEDGQIRMAKGCQTIWDQIKKPLLNSRTFIIETEMSTSEECE